MFTQGLTLIISAAIISTVSVLLVNAIIQRKRQETEDSKINVMEYSDRYSSTMSRIVEQVQDLNTDNFDRSNGKLRSGMVDFFKLIEAEHNLAQNNVIDGQTWEKWENGINKHLSQKVFREGFVYVENQIYVNKFFLKYVKDKMERYHKEDLNNSNKQTDKTDKIVQLQKKVG